MSTDLGEKNILIMTLDTCRYDTAEEARKAGMTPFFAKALGGNPWELRHTPGNFTYAAHHAFFAGFLPTMAFRGPCEKRPFALRFEGSATTGVNTLILDGANIVEGFANLGHHTICIGGVGFFNKLNPLGSTLPNLFAESHWEPRMGVTEKRSTEYQFDRAIERVHATPLGQKVFLFINVSALHQPNCMYVDGAIEDTKMSQRAALSYVDSEAPRLFKSLAKRGAWRCYVMGDHGTAYGDDGYWGHRLSHPCVWNVPYMEFDLDDAL